MSSQPERHLDDRRPPVVDRRAAIGACFDEHGLALLRLAHLVCQRLDLATQAVGRALDAAFPGSPSPGRPVPTRHLLSRLTYLACRELEATSDDRSVGSAPAGSLDPEGRALVALTLFGDHTYAEAAGLLHLDADVAARAITQALRAKAREITDDGDRARAPVDRSGLARLRSTRLGRS